MIKKLVLFISILMFSGILLWAEELKPIELVKPEPGKGKPIIDILAKRQSLRKYSTNPLPNQVLSELLWAAYGINRPESGKRTVPTTANYQEMDIYVVMATGAYLYDAKNNILKPVVQGDMRAQTGRQGFVKEAPVNLVYVADYSKMTRGSDEDKGLYSYADAGCICENVYLYCAAEGLATVVRGGFDRDALAKALGLRPEQKIVLAQTVGYPGE